MQAAPARGPEDQSKVLMLLVNCSVAPWTMPARCLLQGALLATEFPVHSHMPHPLTRLNSCKTGTFAGAWRNTCSPRALAGNKVMLSPVCTWKQRPELAQTQEHVGPKMLPCMSSKSYAAGACNTHAVAHSHSCGQRPHARVLPHRCK